MEADSWTVRAHDQPWCTRPFSIRSWVRSGSPTHSGGHEWLWGGGDPASGIGRDRDSLYGRLNGRRSRHHKCATGITRQLAGAASPSSASGASAYAQAGQVADPEAAVTAGGARAKREAIAGIRVGQSEHISSMCRADQMESLKVRKAATPRRGKAAQPAGDWHQDRQAGSTKERSSTRQGCDLLQCAWADERRATGKRSGNGSDIERSRGGARL